MKTLLQWVTSVVNRSSTCAKFHFWPCAACSPSHTCTQWFLSCMIRFQWFVSLYDHFLFCLYKCNIPSEKANRCQDIKSYRIHSPCNMDTRKLQVMSSLSIIMASCRWCVYIGQGYVGNYSLCSSMVQLPLRELLSTASNLTGLWQPKFITDMVLGTCHSHQWTCFVLARKPQKRLTQTCDDVQRIYVGLSASKRDLA